MVGSFDVECSHGFTEGLEQFFVFLRIADELFILASEVVELVIQLLEFQVDALDHLYFDQLLVLLLVSGAHL